MLWIETNTDEEVEQRDAAIWDLTWEETPNGGLQGSVPGPREEGGEFWYETLQKSKSDPTARFAIAQRHLPLPASWNEMAVALRAMVRADRKEGRDPEVHLRELHRLAAIWSFAVENAADRGRGYGVLEMTPYARVAALDYSWEKIGCDELILLKVTDRKWMREAWGEPATHTTAKQLYADFYRQEEARVARQNEAKRARQRAKWEAEIDALLAEEGGNEEAAQAHPSAPPLPSPQPSSSDGLDHATAPKKQGFFSKLFRR